MSRPTYEPLSQNEDHLPAMAQAPSRPLVSSSAAVQHGRPPTYYGEGPFSPPSSDAGENDEDDDDEAHEKSLDARRRMLLHRPPQLQNQSMMDLEDVHPDYLPPYEIGDGLKVGSGKMRTPLKALLISLAALILLASMIGVLAAYSYSGSNFLAVGRKPLTMDHIFNGTFYADRTSLDWVAEAGDGIFSTRENGDIVLRDLRTNTSRVLVERADVRDEHGAPLYWTSWKLSADMKYLLIKTDERKQWRHSSFGNYYIYGIDSKKTVALMPPTNPPTVAYATWSPTGEAIAYVASNDLYILPSLADDAKPIRVTSDGNSSIFNGVPDWVYEEEVFADDYALWWSPDSTKLAFTRLDETKVDTFTYPVYNPSIDAFRVHPYTDFVTMKYPKPGYPNPIVSLHLFELDKYQEMVADAAPETDIHSAVANATLELTWDGRRSPTDSIITEVTWVSKQSLIIKEVNRSASDGSVVLFDLMSTTYVGGRGRAVRKLGKDGEQGDDGWIDAEQTIYPIPAQGDQPAAYLDIVPTPEGYNHIALFSPPDSGVPRWLTSGPWEVDGGIKAVDHIRRLVYFVGTVSSSTERHVFSVPLPQSFSALPTPPGAPTPLTDSTQSAYYTVDFSPLAGYYLLGYEGPNIPWQKVVSVENKTFNYILNDNARLNVTASQFQAPTIIHQKIESDGYELNAVEIRPPSLDDSGRVKYPVLFHVYGGPFSQTVNTRWSRGWHHYLACSLKYVVVIVDGRGTGWKGRQLRNPVRGNLGYFETKDQINAAKIWASKRYVDTKRIGIWGWSYGGFMASKVAEADAGIHSLAMSVAPVTSWRLYDSVYTERYMGLPQDNPSGYTNASISDVSGFHNINFLLAHGSGDDNVHFANSAHLLDMLTQDQVRGFWFRMFTDSDHSIGKRGAYRELHEWMTSFLLEKWGKGAIRRSG
ncbi:hypothetical protein FS837_010276 [Tulasnella sp. UAMH 9824]|nr:hypothetical protein FS837_010276 [Tulasnella sp. UAMH 9824]